MIPDTWPDTWLYDQPNISGEVGVLFIIHSKWTQTHFEKHDKSLCQTKQGVNVISQSVS